MQKDVQHHLEPFFKTPLQVNSLMIRGFTDAPFLHVYNDNRFPHPRKFLLVLIEALIKSTSIINRSIFPTKCVDARPATFQRALFPSLNILFISCEQTKIYVPCTLYLHHRVCSIYPGLHLRHLEDSLNEFNVFEQTLKLQNILSNLLSSPLLWTLPIPFMSHRLIINETSDNIVLLLSWQHCKRWLLPNLYYWNTSRIRTRSSLTIRIHLIWSTLRAALISEGLDLGLHRSRWASFACGFLSFLTSVF